MMQALPVGKFQWMTKSALQNWERIVNSENTGCTLEVDLEYPRNLHDFHDDFPLAPELLETNGFQKLIPNLRDKYKMVLDGRSLQLFLSLGMKLKKLHRGIQFRKEAFMKPSLNTTPSSELSQRMILKKTFSNLPPILFTGKPWKC